MPQRRCGDGCIFEPRVSATPDRLVEQATGDAGRCRVERQDTFAIEMEDEREPFAKQTGFLAGTCSMGLRDPGFYFSDGYRG